VARVDGLPIGKLRSCRITLPCQDDPEASRGEWRGVSVAGVDRLLEGGLRPSRIPLLGEYGAKKQGPDGSFLVIAGDACLPECRDLVIGIAIARRSKANPKGVVAGNNLDQLGPRFGWDRPWLVCSPAFVRADGVVEHSPGGPVRVDLLKQRDLGGDRARGPFKTSAE